jgi:hypothetical protein
VKREPLLRVLLITWTVGYVTLNADDRLDAALFAD